MRVITMPRVIAALATLTLAVGCSDATGPDPDQRPGTLPTGGMTIVPSGATLAPGQVVLLKAHLITSSGDALAGVPVTWSTSNESVAVVSARGEVHARGPGIVAITAQAQGKAQIATIRVVQPGKPVKSTLFLKKPNMDPGRRSS